MYHNHTIKSYIFIIYGYQMFGEHCLFLVAWFKKKFYKFSMLSLFCVWVFFPVPLCGLPGGKGTAVPSVCHSGEATAGETRVAGAQEAEAGRRAGEGGHSLTFVSFGTCSLYNEKTAQNFTFTLHFS